MTVSFQIEGDPCGEMNPNRVSGRHWATKKRLTEKHQLLAANAWQDAGRPFLAGRVTLKFTVCRSRSMDVDNAIAGLKATIDGLKGRLFTDDRAKYLREVTVRFSTSAAFKAEPFLVVEAESEVMDGG